MDWKTVTVVVALAWVPTAARAEIAECSHRDSFTGDTMTWRIDAARDGSLPAVMFADGYSDGPKPAKVLHHSSTGIPGGAGLGISSIMLMQPDGDGYTLPSLITIDWTALKFAHAYVPFLQGRENFMIANVAYKCVRLD